MSNEHVIRNALRRYLRVHHPQMQTRQVYLSDKDVLEQSERTAPHGPFDMKVKHVCKGCNEGWMEKLVEVPAEPYIAAMLRGEKLLVTKAGASAVGLWAAKTAAVRSLMDKGRRAIPEAHFHHIREKLEPPPNTYAWVANSHYVANTVTRHLRFQLPDLEARPTCHITTILYGHMAMFVLGMSDTRCIAELESTIVRMDTLPTLRIWPEPASTMWPPPVVDESLLAHLSAPDGDFIEGEVLPMVLDIRHPSSRN